MISVSTLAGFGRSGSVVAAVKEIGDILDRLGLRRNEVITQAAQILYGTRFLPDYPQGMLKMGRFRGTKITGDILDNKQEHLHAFSIVREAIAWLDRTLPLAARFPPGEIFREDRLPVPAEALREVLLNAVMHRDYSEPGSCVAVAVFDDRIEIRSTGALPRGVTAEAFHRTGAVEIWGRGTNRVVEECERHGVEPPTFEEAGGGLTVTFRAAIGPTPQVTPQVVAILKAGLVPRTRAELQEAAGLKDREHFRKGHLEPLLEAGLLEMTIPDKPTSSRQRYRTTESGARVLSE